MVKYVEYLLGENAKKPFKKYDGDAGWDLFVSRPCFIPPGRTMDIHTDLRINMPSRMYARIVGRSSTLRNHHLLVNEAIIDNGYTGEMFICVHNLGDQGFQVQPGMRLAQIIFGTIEDVRWVGDSIETQTHFLEIENNPKKRKNNGFGSTGV